MDDLLLFMEHRVFLPLLIAIALGIVTFFRLDILNAGVISFISLYLFSYIANDAQLSFLLSKSAIIFYWISSILGIAVSVFSLIRRKAKANRANQPDPQARP